MLTRNLNFVSHGVVAVCRGLEHFRCIHAGTSVSLLRTVDRSDSSSAPTTAVPEEDASAVSKPRTQGGSSSTGGIRNTGPRPVGRGRGHLLSRSRSADEIADEIGIPFHAPGKHLTDDGLASLEGRSAGRGSGSAAARLGIERKPTPRRVKTSDERRTRRAREQGQRRGRAGAEDGAQVPPPSAEERAVVNSMLDTLETVATDARANRSRARYAYEASSAMHRTQESFRPLGERRRAKSREPREPRERRPRAAPSHVEDELHLLQEAMSLPESEDPIDEFHRNCLDRTLRDIMCLGASGFEPVLRPPDEQVLVHRDLYAIVEGLGLEPGSPEHRRLMMAANTLENNITMTDDDREEILVNIGAWNPGKTKAFG